MQCAEGLAQQTIAQQIGIAHLRLHRLDATADLAPLGASSKLRTHSAFLARLHTLGRQAADRWLAAVTEHMPGQADDWTTAMRWRRGRWNDDDGTTTM